MHWRVALCGAVGLFCSAACSSDEDGGAAPDTAIQRSIPACVLGSICAGGTGLSACMDEHHEGVQQLSVCVRQATSCESFSACRQSAQVCGSDAAFCMDRFNRTECLPDGRLEITSCLDMGKMCEGRSCRDDVAGDEACDGPRCEGSTLVRCQGTDRGVATIKHDCRLDDPDFTCVPSAERGFECGAAQTECGRADSHCEGSVVKVCVGGKFFDVDCGAYFGAICVAEGVSGMTGCSLP